jgi:small subunit ribosomal protein S1
VEKPEDVLQEGQEVTARILEVNPAERRIRLSLSALQQPDESQEQQQAQPRRHSDEERSEKPRRRQGEGRQSKEAVLPQEDASVTIGDYLGGMFSNGGR